MHIVEFKAWFEGFTEAMRGPPSAKQWERIKTRVSEIDNAYTPSQVFIDRYWNPYRYYTPVYTSAPSYTISASGKTDTSCLLQNFTTAGRAESASLSAGA